MCNWPDAEHVEPAKVPGWYRDCFRAALLRMAVVVNAHRHKRDKTYPVDPKLLLERDTVLFGKLESASLAPALISLNPIDSDHRLSEDNEYRAENFFYARIGFSEQGRAVKGGAGAFPRTQVTYEVPDTFIEWSYLRLQRPRVPDERLERKAFSNEEQFVFECATNYLLKNFWHNFVHRQLQGINEGNYRDFSGEARFDSDFEADNLATVFLVRSYGLPIRTAGTAAPNRGDAIRAVWERNRCNLVFQERARHRHQDTARMTELERYQEAEWRFFRAICNRLSIELVARNMAVRSLRIFANGQIKKGRIGYFRTGPGNVIVELNSRRYHIASPVYVPPEYYGAKQGTQKRLDEVRAFQNRRINDIATSAATRYGHDLNLDANLRAYAGASMDALFNRLSLPR